MANRYYFHAHEHFISTLIKQKILLNIEKILNQEESKETKTFVLFLPIMKFMI